MPHAMTSYSSGITTRTVTRWSACLDCGADVRLTRSFTGIAAQIEEQEREWNARPVRCQRCWRTWAREQAA